MGRVVVSLDYVPTHGSDAERLVEMKLFGLLELKEPDKVPNKTKINVRLAVELVAAIVQYQQRERYSTFSAAVERLLWAGARAEKVVE